jgi:hypothetical protein
MVMNTGAANGRQYHREILRVRTMVKKGGETKWTPFPVYDVSANGVAIRGELPEDVGAIVQVHTERIGGAGARIVRKGKGVTALELLDDSEAPLRASRVQWQAQDGINQRAHQRARPEPKAGKQLLAPVVWPDGRTEQATVLDISAGGIQLAGLRAPCGAALRVAGVAGHVVRVSEESVAVSFDDNTNSRRIELIAMTLALEAAPDGSVLDPARISSSDGSS